MVEGADEIVLQAVAGLTLGFFATFVASQKRGRIGIAVILGLAILLRVWAAGNNGVDQIMDHLVHDLAVALIWIGSHGYFTIGFPVGGVLYFFLTGVYKDK